MTILTIWELWKHRDDCVFNGAKPEKGLLYNPSLMKTSYGVGLGLLSLVNL